MSDPTQRHLPRHPRALIDETAAALAALTVADLSLYTLDNALEVLSPIIQDKLDSGARWDSLERWFQRRGFGDITAAAYREWLQRKQYDAALSAPMATLAGSSLIQE